MQTKLYLRFSLLLFLLLAGTSLLRAAIIRVNDNSTVGDVFTNAVGNDATGTGSMNKPYATIMKAISVASAGDEVRIDAGTYIEQVLITKSLELQGAGRTLTFIKAPATVPNVTTSNGNSAQPIVFVSGASTTTIIRKLTVSGNGGRDLPDFAGVVYDEASGTFKNARITEIRWSTFNGVQSGLAFVASHVWDVLQTQTIIIDNNLIDDFQKNGITVGEPGTVATITDNTVTGKGAASVGVIGQNGIQVGFGAQASLSNNTIQDHLYNTALHPANEYESAGVLVYDAQVNVQNGNTFTNNENAILAYDDPGFPYPTAVNYSGTNTFSNNRVHISYDGGPAPSGGTLNFDKRVDNTAQTGNVYGSLGYAVYWANANNTLNASAGTYNEGVLISNNVAADPGGTRDRSGLTINGPNAGINPNTGARVGEAIVSPGSAVAFDIRQSGFTLDGFKFTGSANSNAVITNQLFSDGGGNNVTLKNLLFDTNTGMAFWIDKLDNSAANRFTNWNILNNRIVNIGGTNRSGMNINDISGLTISGNYTENTAYAGIQVENVGNVSITNNTIRNVPKHGIQVGTQGANGLTLMGNDISGANTSGDANQGGIRLYPDALTGQIRVLNNISTNSLNGLYVLSSGSLTGKDVLVNGNDFAGNSAKGIHNANAGQLSAECNWYGSSNASAVAAYTSGPVDFTPFLFSGTDTAPGTPGFQPNLATCGCLNPSFTGTPTVSGVPVCRGNSVVVNFSTACPPGLQYSLQLSNASGSFTSGAITLGNYSSGSSVLIPASVPAGSGYRIRVMFMGGSPVSNNSAAFRVRDCGSVSTRLAAETSAEDGGLQVSISPNPTEGLLRLGIRGGAGQTLKVELFNGSGQTIRQQGIEQAQAEETLSWDISRQPQGLYLLRVSGEKEAKTVKIVH
ncbi:MAG: right-handed parallel beta-helix repeat-containing protein [Cytophagaceae bacterium]|nr:right-handed parallel beta-helix repeat-containing protein [Cytophagaceae bacterium]